MAIGIIEIQGLCTSMAALDAMDKKAGIRLLQVELNDNYGVVMKIEGEVSAVRSAVLAGEERAARMGGNPVSTLLNSPDDEAMKAIHSKPEYNPLLEAGVVRDAQYQPISDLGDTTMENYAIGLIETQGFTAVFEAIDTACKAANVQVIGKEKLGGGYVTVLIRGDVAAVTAAVEAGKEKVGALGKLIAAHVIARPSEAVLSLIPK